MAERKGAPSWLSPINVRTRTPVRATAPFTVAVFVLASWSPLVALAQATSATILIVFAFVNFSLLALRIGEAQAREHLGPGMRDAVPLVGVLACLGFLVLQARELLP